MGKPAKRVLVIDDSPDLRELYELLFAGEGYDVQAASDALRGFERARNWHPDVILLDVVMPGMDGLELLRKLRSDLVPPVPPVILCSGFELSEAEAIDRGAVRFLRKPTESEDLLTAVRDAMNAKRPPSVKAKQQRIRSSAARARVLDTARERAELIQAAFRRFRELPGVLRSRSLGMIGALDLTGGDGSLQRRGQRVYLEALRRGAYLRPLGNTVYITPPLNISPADLAELLDIVEDSIKAAN